MIVISFNYMVESSIALDNIFRALADQTRRDIMSRVVKTPLSISELAEPYKMSFAAVAKHVSVLERAQLIVKKRQGKEQIVIVVPSTLQIAEEYIERYAKMWGDRFDNLEALLKK